MRLLFQSFLVPYPSENSRRTHGTRERGYSGVSGSRKILAERRVPEVARKNVIHNIPMADEVKKDAIKNPKISLGFQ